MILSAASPRPISPYHHAVTHLAATLSDSPTACYMLLAATSLYTPMPLPQEAQAKPFLPSLPLTTATQASARTMQQQRQVNASEGMVANVSGRSGGGGGAGGGGGSVSACRPAGSRWTPTPEQLRILKELYYGCGIRSPNAEQIQRISARLRQHGKIEGKNVFYWFQNHKARERQKRRLTNLDINTPAAGTDFTDLGVLSLSPSGATSPSTLGMYTGHGGATSMQLNTSADWDNTATATEGCFLQDYMGVRSTGGGHGSTGAATSPSSWAWFSGPTTTTRAPETLPLFPTGDDYRPRPRHGSPGDASRGGSYLPNLPFWGAAPAAAAATTTTVTIQQHHQLLQLQQQYNFFSNNQLPGHETQDASAAAAGASLELSLSSWCSPYPSGTM